MTTEEKILIAARDVFIQKGFAGARMQEIADAAEINKAMLHYYYRSKEKLFRVIAFDTFKGFMPRIGEWIDRDLPLIDRLMGIVNTYLETLTANPTLPLFVLHELSRQGEEFVADLKDEVSQLPDFAKLIMAIQNESASGKIRPVNPFHLLLSMMSMTVFPFICRPIFTGIIGASDADYNSLIESRSSHIEEVLQRVLIPTN